MGRPEHEKKAPPAMTWLARVPEDDRCYCMDLDDCDEMDDHPCHDKTCKFCHGTGTRCRED